MTLYVTLTLLALAVSAALICAWRGAKPPRLVGRPRLVPWQGLMLAFLSAGLALGAHLASLGLDHDPPTAAAASAPAQPGRFASLVDQSDGVPLRLQGVANAPPPIATLQTARLDGAAGVLTARR